MSPVTPTLTPVSAAIGTHSLKVARAGEKGGSDGSGAEGDGGGGEGGREGAAA